MSTKKPERAHNFAAAGVLQGFWDQRAVVVSSPHRSGLALEAGLGVSLPWRGLLVGFEQDAAEVVMRPHERFPAFMRYESVDRVPLWEWGPWPSTLLSWQRGALGLS